MAEKYYFYAIVLLIAISTTLAIQCFPCDQNTCPKMTCPRGYVKDPCDCCMVCGRSLGETCGGFHGNKGFCNSGLQCISEGDNDIDDTFGGEIIGECLPEPSYWSKILRYLEEYNPEVP